MKVNNHLPVGVFDSGVGGLTVVKEIFKQLPNESLVYFGDTARVPYGNKSKEVVEKFSLQILNFLHKQRVKLIVVACNTASAYALETIRKNTKLPVLDVIEPGAKKAVEITCNDKIGIIGTEGTIKSQAYDKAVNRFADIRDVRIFSQACPLFVPLVEEGWADDSHKKIVKDVAKKYLTPLKRLKIDSLILGCTHYPWLENIIAEIMGKKVKLVSSAYETACSVKETLYGEGMLSELKTVQHKFFFSDAPEKAIMFGNKYSVKYMDATNVKKIDIEAYSPK
ncbi:MAG: glutamate racemase [Elusimicrobia bacterium]|nr:glutamate racemase [Elusimicrobiota bacterium]MBU2613951.1 glutamate racemase [Elusimicrobiota bacterium]